LIKSVQANGSSMAIVQSNQQSHRGHIPPPQPSGSQHSLHSTNNSSRVKELKKSSPFLFRISVEGHKRDE
jgi:hypothetical protein